MKLTISAFLLLFAAFLVACKSDFTAQQYVDLRYHELIAKLGKPESENEFIYNYTDTLHEYQGNLYQVLGKQQGVKIKELWWKQNDIIAVVWLRKSEGVWRSIDSISYDSKKVAF